MAKVRSARSPISANSQSLCGFSGERLHPFCELASTLPVCRQRPTQAVAVDSPIPNRRPAPAPKTTAGNHGTAKFRIYPTGNRSRSMPVKVLRSGLTSCSRATPMSVGGDAIPQQLVISGPRRRLRVDGPGSGVIAAHCSGTGRVAPGSDPAAGSRTDDPIQRPDAGAATLTVATTPGWVSARPRDCIASSWRGNLVAARWALCGACCDCRHAAPCVFQPWSAPRS